jgi:predicted RNA-binding Zn ribbon-like protein
MKNAKNNQFAEQKLSFYYQGKYVQMDGGTPALNFVNTLRHRSRDKSIDYLKNYEAFIDWCGRAKIIDDDYASHLNFEGYCYTREAAEVFERIITARFMLYELFMALIKREAADEIFMTSFNKLADTATAHLLYQITADGFDRVWHNIDDDLEAPLWMIIESAAYLLLYADKSKIKQCKSCDSLFYDKTTNGTRVWCNPAKCGQAVRAHRHYHANANPAVVAR